MRCAFLGRHASTKALAYRPASSIPRCLKAVPDEDEVVVAGALPIEEPKIPEGSDDL